MNILKFSRRPYLSIFMASLILFVSCSEGAVAEIKQSFNYKSFDLYKSTNHYKNIIKSLSKSNLSKSTILEQKKLIVKEVNNELNTELHIPEIALDLSINMNPEEIYTVGLSNNWINQQDVGLVEKFGNDLQTFGFEIAIRNYEDTVINLNLSDTEFARKNAFLNIIKTINYENPLMFQESSSSLEKSNLQMRSWWRCALAITALVAATASLSACPSVGGCVLALALIYNASLAVAEQC